MRAVAEAQAASALSARLTPLSHMVYPTICGSLPMSYRYSLRFFKSTRVRAMALIILTLLLCRGFPPQSQAFPPQHGCELASVSLKELGRLVLNSVELVPTTRQEMRHTRVLPSDTIGGL